MLVKRRSPVSGIVREREIPITVEQYEAWIAQGTLIQKAFPELSSGDREFILTGITEDEWDEMFKEDDLE